MERYAMSNNEDKTGFTYPRKNSKVSCSKIHFRWDHPTETDFNFDLFKLIPRSNQDPDPKLELMDRFEKKKAPVITDKTNTKEYACNDELQHGFYLASVTPLSDSSTSPFDVYFYTKERKNYLKEYLINKFERETSSGDKPFSFSPVIPVFFHLLEKYLKDEPLDQRIDRPFKENMKAIKENMQKTNIPVNDDKLAKSLDFFNEIRKEAASNNYFGDLSLEWNNKDSWEGKDTWFEYALGKLENHLNQFTNRYPLGGYTKEVSITVKVAVSGGTELFTINFSSSRYKNDTLTDNLKVPVDDQFIGAADNALNPDLHYKLQINTSPSNHEIPFTVKEDQDASGYYLSIDKDILNLNSTNYEGCILLEGDNNVWTEKGHGWEDIKLEIRGGCPVIIDYYPRSITTKYGGKITLKIRDPGEINKLPALPPPIDIYSSSDLISGESIEVEQRADYSVFEFTPDSKDLGKLEPDHTTDYYMRFQNKSGETSEKQINIKHGYEYILSLSELKCIDESDPERFFGLDDTINVLTFINTKYFVQFPSVRSGQYSEMKDDTAKTTNDFLIKPLMYHNPTGENIIPLSEIEENLDIKLKRIIEEYLEIGVSIFEYDDLDWLAACINAVISHVQSFLTSIVGNIIPFGGVLLNIALEASGVNDMREEAIDALVSSFEVEVLHEGKITIRPGQVQDQFVGNVYKKSKTFVSDESKYKTTFELERIPVPDTGFSRSASILLKGCCR